MATMQSFRYHRDGDIEIYRRILKYSPFALKRRKSIHQSIHKLDNGNTIKAVAAEVVTVEDAEKMYALILKGKTDTAKEVCDSFSIVAVHCKLSDIKNATHCHDYRNIVEALQRVTGLTIQFEFAKDDKITTHIIHKIKVNEEKDTVTAMFDADFYRACQEKSLTLHFPTYQQLPPAAKNLYGFIISNSGNVFNEKLLLERAGITEGRICDRQTTLKKSLQELVDRAIIAGYNIQKKNGKRMYHFARIKETIDADCP